MLASSVSELLSAGSGLVVATVAPDGTPCAARGWAVVVVDAHVPRLRAVVGTDVDVEAGMVLALTAGDVRTNRAVQVKGPVVLVAPPTDADLEAFGAHSTAFMHNVNAVDGTGVTTLQRLLPQHVQVIEFDVVEVYDQTPGPAAGASLSGSER